MTRRHVAGPAGTYGSSPGQTSRACSGDCFYPSYCPAGTVHDNSQLQHFEQVLVPVFGLIGGLLVLAFALAGLSHLQNKYYVGPRRRLFEVVTETLTGEAAVRTLPKCGK